MDNHWEENYVVVTLTFSPCTGINMWKTLIAPVNRIPFVWGKTVAIDKTGIILERKKQNTARFVIYRLQIKITFRNIKAVFDVPNKIIERGLKISPQTIKYLSTCQF